MVAGVAGLSFAAARWTVDTSPPSFRPLVQRGLVTGARFGLDGKTVYIQRRLWRRALPHLRDSSRANRIDAARSSSGFLMGVSRKDELVVLLTNSRLTYSVAGTVARVPAIGGTPRALVDAVTYADWAPDGERMAIVRSSGACEFPIGRVIAQRCSMARVSPKSDEVCGTERGPRLLLGADGLSMVSARMPFAFGFGLVLPDGREIWFTGSEHRQRARPRPLRALARRRSPAGSHVSPAP